jgi:hypothetical protein
MDSKVVRNLSVPVFTVYESDVTRTMHPRSSLWDKHSQLRKLVADSYKLLTISQKQYRQHHLVGDTKSFFSFPHTQTYIHTHSLATQPWSEMRLKSLLEALGSWDWELCYEMNRVKWTVWREIDDEMGSHCSRMKLESSFTCQAPLALLPMRVTGVRCPTCTIKQVQQKRTNFFLFILGSG